MAGGQWDEEAASRRIRAPSETLGRGNRGSIDGASVGPWSNGFGVHIRRVRMSQMTGVREMWGWGLEADPEFMLPKCSGPPAGEIGPGGL